MTSPYYLNDEWTHRLFPLAFPSSLYDTTSSFEPYDHNSLLLLRRLNSNPAMGLFHTLPEGYSNAHGIQDQDRRRVARFTVTGQIVHDDLVFGTVPAPSPYSNSHTVTTISFWVEARPDPASHREWQGVLTSLQSITRLVGQPVDTSNFYVTSAGTIRIRVHGGYWRVNTQVCASGPLHRGQTDEWAGLQAAYPLLDADGDRILLTERDMIPLHSGIRVVFRVECERRGRMLSLSAPLTYLGLL